MPIPKGRGKVVRTRTKKVGSTVMTCHVMEKRGPKGGQTVCFKKKRA